METDSGAAGPDSEHRSGAVIIQTAFDNSKLDAALVLIAEALPHMAGYYMSRSDKNNWCKRAKRLLGGRNACN